MNQQDKICLIRELYEAGSSIEAIAEVVGNKPSTVNQLLSRSGLKRVRRMEDDVEKIIELRKTGCTLRDISEKTGYTPTGLSMFLRKIGLGKNNNVAMEVREPELIDENTVYAIRRPRIFRCVINGKRYIDVTEAFM